ncbi:MAG: hypothetical protein ACRCXT_13935 [Paraclostridium sp.]
MTISITKHASVTFTNISKGVTYTLSDFEVNHELANFTTFILNNPTNATFANDKNSVKFYLSTLTHDSDLINRNDSNSVIIDTVNNILTVEIMNERLIEGSDYKLEFEIIA